MRSKFLNIVLAALIVCGGFSLVGCATTSSSTMQTKTPYEQAQTYVNSLNSVASDLSTKYGELASTYSSGDAVATRLKINEIEETLDKVASIEVPAALSDEGKKYQSACEDMKSALSLMEEATKSDTTAADAATKVQEAQVKYDAAVKSFNEADESLKSKLNNLKS